MERFFRCEGRPIDDVKVDDSAKIRVRPNMSQRVPLYSLDKEDEGKKKKKRKENLSLAGTCSKGASATAEDAYPSPETHHLLDQNETRSIETAAYLLEHVLLHRLGDRQRPWVVPIVLEAAE